jgi:hypothetical protein
MCLQLMAGGAEPNEDYCSDDDDLDPVDTGALKKRFNIQDSAETLNLLPENLQIRMLLFIAQSLKLVIQLKVI